MELCTFHFRGASAAGEVDFSYGHYIRDLARVGAECGVSNGRAGCVERGCSTFFVCRRREDCCCGCFLHLPNGIGVCVRVLVLCNDG